MMQSYDIIVVGGGMVGLAFAASLKDSDYNILIIDTQQPSPISEGPHIRVSAVNLASEYFLKNIGAWQQIPEARLSPFGHMSVWDQDSFGSIHFDGTQVQQNHLGHIIENDVLRLALWQQVEQMANVTIKVPGVCKQVGFNDEGAMLSLENGDMISCKWLVAADGANSWLRSQAQIPMTFWDYQHNAIVATIRTEHPHQQTARQIFTPDGPLAFLPLWDEHLCSIVWSVSHETGAKLMSLNKSAFEQTLATAFDMKLGLCTLASQKAKFPLKMRFAREFVKQSLILLGDAAHTIHPLAGQGVNLGFMDAASLAQTLLETDNPDLGKFERWRKTEAAEMIAVMEGFKRLFSGDDPVKKMIRGIGLALADEIAPAKELMIRYAIGLEGDLPELARKPL